MTLEGQHISKWERREWMAFGGLSLFFFIWTFLSRNNPFFWDGILNAKIATFYLETKFAYLVPPERIDAGHTPGFNLYLALVWKVFGRSLWASHLAVLPILIGVAVQWVKLCKRYLSESGFWIGVAFLLVEPAFLTQSFLVSPDVALVFFYFLAMNGILEHRRWMISLAVIGLAFSSFRGVLMLVPVFIFDLYIHRTTLKDIWKQGILTYIPVSVLILSWFWLHIQVQGWLISPPAETYGDHRKMVSLYEFLRNVGIFGWRMLDNGRFALWVAVLGVATYHYRSILAYIKEKQEVLFLFVLPTGFFLLLLTPFSNPIGHRYLMVCFLLFVLNADQLFEQWVSTRTKLTVFLICMALNFSGHFWVYPDTVAKGWDAMLSHVSWYSARQEMIDFVQAEGLTPGEICTGFPNITGKEFTDLLPKENWSFVGKEDVGFDQCPYIIQSNIFNGFSDAELAGLKTEWELKKDIVKGRVYVRLYQKKE